MKELGILNRDIAALISCQGHGDLMMVADAGFAIPDGVAVIDLSIKENVPRILDVLKELAKYFSVEKMHLSRETRECNPSHFRQVSQAFGDHVELEVMPHQELKNLSKKVKGVIRTGDFTSYGNVILVSGAGERWQQEKVN